MDKTLSYLSSLNDQDYEWHATRVDMAFDHVPFTPRQYYDPWLNLNYRSRAQYKFHDWRENLEGRTFNIGSQKSGRFIRIYDRRGFTRLEIEFKQEWAKKVGDLLSKSSFEDWRDKCTGYLRDYVDFVDTNGGKFNKTQSGLLLWRSEFVGNEKADLKREKKNEGNLLAKSKKHLERMAPTL